MPNTHSLSEYLSAAWTAAVRNATTSTDTTSTMTITLGAGVNYNSGDYISLYMNSSDVALTDVGVQLDLF